MRETLDEYKKILETNLFKFTYLYDGDIKSSNKLIFSSSINHGNTSPTFIISCIDDIYHRSMKNMMDKAIDITISCEYLNPFLINEYILEFESKYNFKTKYLFCSDKSNLGIKSDNRTLFPSYFYIGTRYSMLDYNLYYSPLISNYEDQIDVYITDSSIQGLVYSIQNMEYIIEKVGDVYDHKIIYDLYDCDFKSYKLCIKNISKLRDDKIEILLNGN